MVRVCASNRVGVQWLPLQLLWPNRTTYYLHLVLGYDYVKPHLDQLPSLLINSVEYFTITLTSAVLVNLLPNTWLMFCFVLFSVVRQSPEFDQKLFFCSENNKQSYFLHLGTIICQSILSKTKLMPPGREVGKPLAGWPRGQRCLLKQLKQLVL